MYITPIAKYGTTMRHNCKCWFILLDYYCRITAEVVLVSL